MVTPESINDSDKKTHPWRRCPMGKHFVREHKVHIPPSKKHPNGIVSTRHEHCAENRSHKDELSFDEIQHITNTYFPSLTGPPTPQVLVSEFSKADNYDLEIRGWVKYWNDIFKLDDPLDPNLVKALIATESGFRTDPKTNKIARGITQVRNTTRKYLADTKDELKNYLVVLTNEQLLNSSSNICAGVRWLFRKKEIASSKLKHTATWINTIEDYKGYLDKILNKEDYNHTPMEKLDKYYKLLQENNNENKNSASSLLLTDTII